VTFLRPQPRRGRLLLLLLFLEEEEESSGGVSVGPPLLFPPREEEEEELIGDEADAPFSELNNKQGTSVVVVVGGIETLRMPPPPPEEDELRSSTRLGDEGGVMTFKWREGADINPPIVEMLGRLPVLLFPIPLLESIVVVVGLAGGDIVLNVVVWGMGTSSSGELESGVRRVVRVTDC